MAKSPEIAILQVPGINADNELSYAFELAGAKPTMVHISELVDRSKKLDDFAAIGIPGGFSYRDDPQSGALLGLKLDTYLADDIKEFLESGERMILGICNGNQVLVKSGLLPFGAIGEVQGSLQHNSEYRFECEQVNLRVEKESRVAKIVGGIDDIISIPVAHGEGRFVASEPVMQRVEDEGLVVARYCDTNGDPTQEYPLNPNGSTNAIAALTDPKGQIIGFMPHPERATTPTQHPNWRRLENSPQLAQGLALFKGIVAQVSQM